MWLNITIDFKYFKLIISLFKIVIKITHNTKQL